MRTLLLRDRRIAAVAAATAVVLLVTGLAVIVIRILPGTDGTGDGQAGIGGIGPDGNNALSPNDPGGTPSPGATRPVSGTPVPTGGVTGGPVTAPTSAAPSYPTTAKAYALAVLNAWKTHDSARLGQLATPAALTLMGKAPASLASGWETYDCWVESFSPCREARNDVGDVFSVSVDPTKLGKAKAVTRAYVDLTRYAGDPTKYLYNVLDAWYAKNEERVATLIDGQQSVWFFSTIPNPGDHTAYSEYVTFTSGTDPTNRVCISAKDNTAQSSYWHFGVDKRRLGTKHALVFANGSESGPYC